MGDESPLVVDLDQHMVAEIAICTAINGHSPYTLIRSVRTWHGDCPRHLSSSDCGEDAGDRPSARDCAWLRSGRL